MKKNKRIFYLILITIIILLILISKILHVNIDSELYAERTINKNNISIDYPYFNNKMDEPIYQYLKSIEEDNTFQYKYVVTQMDGYTNILFKIYEKNVIVSYKTFLFNKENKEVALDAILDLLKLNEKLDLYVYHNKLKISKDELSKATINFSLKSEKIDLYLTNYNDKNEIIFIPLYYNELEDNLKIKVNYNKDYSLMNTTTTTTTTVPLIPPKVVAFTFDDGPSKYTLELLDILDEYQAKATFFEVGYNIRARSEVTAEVIRRGFEVGNHTIDHSKLTKLSNDAMLEKINSDNELFYSITNANMKYLRPPYGSYNDTLKSIISTPIINWSLDTEDWKSRNTDKIVAEVLNNLKEGDIVLFHDLYQTSIEAVRILLPILYQDNYKVVSVTELFAINNVVPQNGHVYHNAR